MPTGVYKHKPSQLLQKGHKFLGGGNKGMKWKQTGDYKSGRYERTEEMKMRESKKAIENNWGKRFPLVSGDKHPCWKGDKCKKHQERNDSAYVNWMRRVKRRDGGICKMKNEDCKGYCIAHHILGWEKFPELRYSINNGITLCQFHHPRKRADEQRLIPFFQRLVEVI